MNQMATLTSAPAPPNYNNSQAQESSRHVAAVLAHFTQSHEALGRLAQERDDVIVLLDSESGSGSNGNNQQPPSTQQGQLSIAYISPSCMRVVRCTPASLFGKRIVSLLHPDDIALVLSAITSVQQSAVPSSIYARFTRMDRVGEYVLVDMNIRAVDTTMSTGANGPVKAYIMLVARVFSPTPIDTIHTLRIQNLQLRAALAEAVAGRREFDGGAASSALEMGNLGLGQKGAGGPGSGMGARGSVSGGSGVGSSGNAGPAPGAPKRTSSVGSMPPANGVTAQKKAAAVSLLQELETIGWGAQSTLSGSTVMMDATPSLADAKGKRASKSGATDDDEYMPMGGGSSSGNVFVAPSQVFGVEAVINTATGSQNVIGQSGSSSGGGALSTQTKKTKKVKIPVDELYCHQCGSTTSPEWRKGPLGPKTLCNACGLAYSKQQSKLKKQNLKMQQLQGGSGSGGGQDPGTGIASSDTGAAAAMEQFLAGYGQGGM
ncbi:hypothetical protein BC830DRAFT_1085259 [Chytriomyces sp. MP71]|nr:hypothetical protein BC830DRAFT_1085259 [Chytriomyces sp. MP71]